MKKQKNTINEKWKTKIKNNSVFKATRVNAEFGIETGEKSDKTDENDDYDYNFIVPVFVVSVLQDKNVLLFRPHDKINWLN